MAPIFCPEALVIKIPELRITQQTTFEGPHCRTTYYVTQDLTKVNLESMGRNEVTIHPYGSHVTIVFNEGLALHFDQPSNTLFHSSVADQPNEEAAARDLEVPP